MAAEREGRLAGATSLVVSSVHMAVRDQLRSDILVGHFPAGTRLQQSELAKHYGVSITPIREALRDLASEGLVDFGAFSGAVVHTPTINELCQLYEVRSQLFPLAVASAIANISSRELDEAEELVREMADPPTTAESWAMQNRRLHRILDGAIDNTHLAAMLHRLADISALYVYVSDRGAGRRHEANQEHQSLIDAYRRRDVEEATSLAVAHITHTLEQATNVLMDETAEPGIPSGIPGLGTTDLDERSSVSPARSNSSGPAPERQPRRHR